MSILPYQKRFIDFLVHAHVLTFGEFTLKSGRKAPYFINTGNFNDGEKITHLGQLYAAHIVHHALTKANTIFGPAYKGIPLCVATATGLFNDHGINVGFTFDRKEAKDHGDGGILVGRKLQKGDRIIIVEDVVTAGTTLNKIVPWVREFAPVEILGVVVAVDRCERGTGTLSAVHEIEQNLKVPIFPLVTIHTIVEYLSHDNESGFVLNAEMKDKIAAYLKEYGV